MYNKVFTIWTLYTNMLSKNDLNMIYKWIKYILFTSVEKTEYKF